MSTTKIAIVTGAASGIGRAIALQLADDGLDLVLNDVARSKAPLDEVVQLALKKGRRAVAVTGDVSVEGDVKVLVQVAVDSFGGLDVMIANAGITLAGLIRDTTVEDFDRVFSINARGTFLCYKYAAEQMIKQGRGGRLVGACSMAGKKAGAGIASYSATKFAIAGLTQAAAQEYGKYGITVNAYAPGAIETPLLDKVEEFRLQESGGEKGSWVKSLNGAAALGRNGQPEDVAGLVSFLVSEKARFVTGCNMLVDGGIIFD